MENNNNLLNLLDGDEEILNMMSAVIEQNLEESRNEANVQKGGNENDDFKKLLDEDVDVFESINENEFKQYGNESTVILFFFNFV